MKAYRCDYDDGYEIFSKFYWAKTKGQARSHALYDDELGNPERFLDIDSYRIPWADGLENASDYEFALECLKHGYSYITYDDNGIKRELFEEDVPVLEKVGSVEGFWKLYNKGKIKYNDKGIPYLVNERNNND